MRTTFLLSATAAIASGCSSGADGGPPGDAGPAMDATRVDAGSADAGSADAGRADAATTPDAGSPDAAAAPDAGAGAAPRHELTYQPYADPAPPPAHPQPL